jgi:hypothetical protein
MPDNPKILGLLTHKDGHRAAFVWVCAMAYAGKHGTDGFIPREALTRINARTVDMRLLVENRLLIENAGGWQVASWDEFQISDEAAKQRREKAQNAAAIRWSKSKASGKQSTEHMRRALLGADAQAKERA